MCGIRVSHGFKHPVGTSETYPTFNPAQIGYNGVCVCVCVCVINSQGTF